MESKTIIILLLIIALAIAGFFLYKNYQEMSREIVPVEKHESLTGKPGEGYSVEAICPEDKKAISGGCTVHSDGIKVEDSQLTKSNINLDYYNAWQCGFGFLEEGTHSVTATVNCK